MKHFRCTVAITTVISLCWMSIPAWAGTRTPCVALVGGTLHTPEGVIQSGVLVIEGDRILDVRSGVGAPAHCQIIDVTDKVVTPGLVEPMSHMGLVEVSLENRTADADQAGWRGKNPRRIRSGFQVADAYNPRSTLIPVTRLGGITSAISAPSGGIISGQSVWVDLFGATQNETIQRAPLAMHATLGASEGGRSVGFTLLRGLLEEAVDYSGRRKQWEGRRTHGQDFSRGDVQAMVPVISGDIPLVVQVDRASDIEALLRLAAGLEGARVRLVLAGAAEGWLVRDQLAKAGVAVIVNPLVYGPGSFDQLQGREDNAILLLKAGVPVMFSTWDTHNARSLAQVAGNAVRAGLTHEEALNAITSTPARVFGMTSHGHLSKKALANIVVWSADPLEVTSTAEHVFIRGERVPMESRQTRLRERYRALPGSPSAPLPLP